MSILENALELFIDLLIAGVFDVIRWILIGALLVAINIPSSDILLFVVSIILAMIATWIAIRAGILYLSIWLIAQLFLFKMTLITFFEFGTIILVIIVIYAIKSDSS